jgi:hypothetical protein
MNNNTPSNIVYHLVAKTIMVGLVVLSCFAASFYLAVHALEGWGWFMFIGLICCSEFPSWKNIKEVEDENWEKE